MALQSIISAHSDRLIRLWQPSEPTEIQALLSHSRQGFAWYGLFKVDGLNWVEERTGLDKRWKVVCNGYILVSYDTEAEADTFIRKLHDQINTTDGSGTVKRGADL